METSSNILLNDLVNCRPVNSANETSSKPIIVRRESLDNAYMSDHHSIGAKSSLISQKSFCFPESDLNTMRNSMLRRESSFTSQTFNAQVKGANQNTSSRSKLTVADAFRQQLSSLVELLNSTNPWYVRCIKPNLDKSATEYDDKQVIMQLRYLGMSDLIRIRREGYPIHLTKHQFVCRYRCMMLKHLRSNPTISPIKLEQGCLDNYCRRMMNHFQQDPKHWKIGKTMVYYFSVVRRSSRLIP